jgi:hypothetical protein
MSIFVHPRRETRREQPLEVETSGLLSVLAPGFLEDLMRHGYRPGPAAKQLQVMSHLRPVARRAIWILSHATPPRPGAGRSARAWPEALSFVSYPRAGSYVAINTPVRIVTLSRSRSDASTPRGKSLSLERPAISARTIVSLPPPLVARSGRRPSAAAIAPRPATPGRSHRPAGSCQWRDRSGTEGWPAPSPARNAASALTPPMPETRSHWAGLWLATERQRLTTRADFRSYPIVSSRTASTHARIPRGAGPRVSEMCTL